MLKDNAQVTIVISTYNRPDVLSIAIKSVTLQTFSDWKILVIGDHCEQETEKVVTSFKDSRIQYINLPYRIGTQSGPNSVGIALAKTKYLAFMNHDDIWLQDHLKYAIETLEKTKSDFFIGKCCLAQQKFTSENLEKPKFYFSSPENRTADMSFDKDNLMFETVSSWVIKTSHAKKIGYWKEPREIHRHPLQNWVIRAWREKNKFIFGKKITSLYIFNYHTSTTKNLYSISDALHRFILTLLENKDSNLMRDFLNKDIEHYKAYVNLETPVLKDHPMLKRILINRLTKSLCKNIGLDSVEIFYTFIGKKKGRGMNLVSKMRIGKPLPKKVNIKKMINELNLS